MTRAALWALLVALPAVEVTASESPIPAVAARLATRGLLLDVTAIGGDHLVAVGERGHILLSSDAGNHWVQAAVPVDATLTAVCFSDALHGWAVGHDEVILATTDGGHRWALQHYAPDARQPLLAVACGPQGAVVAVGAFATVYRSQDGGRTWQSSNFEPVAEGSKRPGAVGRSMADDDDTLAQPHLNAIARASDGRLYLAAEAGHLYRSDDQGAHWTSLPSPYSGSFFGILPVEGDAVLAFGLRGHLYRSPDAGRTWSPIESGTDALLAGGVAREGKRVVIVGQAGTVLTSEDGGRRFDLHQRADRKGLSAATRVRDRLITVGEAGVSTLVPGEP